MESPISRNFIDEFAFKKLIEEARKAQLKDTFEKIGEYNHEKREDILDKVLEKSSKYRVQDKFKALKNAGKSF